MRGCSVLSLPLCCIEAYFQGCQIPLHHCIPGGPRSVTLLYLVLRGLIHCGPQGSLSDGSRLPEPVQCPQELGLCFLIAMWLTLSMQRNRRILLRQLTRVKYTVIANLFSAATNESLQSHSWPNSMKTQSNTMVFKRLRKGWKRWGVHVVNC